MNARPLLIAAILAVSILPATLSAQELPPDAPSAQREYVGHLQEIQKLFAAGEYQKAADICNEILKTKPNDALTLYNLACAQARLKQPEDALTTLEKSVKNGMRGADHMEKDDDLASIRDDKKFAAILEAAKANDKAAATGKYDPGEDIPAVKTVEATPDGGLRYRLRIPKDATPEKPTRLIIWLHPSGGYMNKTVEKLSPDLAAHGYALMVLTQKQFMIWNGDEMNQLVNQTLADVRTHKEIDATRPILMGFSAGGQAALMIWQEKPSAWSGLILDAAYPVVAEPKGYALMKLPADADSFKKTPIHVVVGGKDGGSQVWKKCENKWLEAGVPLTVVIVPDKPHTWLITGDILKDTYAWLDDVKAGKLPADTATALPAAPETQPAAAPQDPSILQPPG